MTNDTPTPRTTAVCNRIADAADAISKLGYSLSALKVLFTDSLRDLKSNSIELERELAEAKEQLSRMQLNYDAIVRQVGIEYLRGLTDAAEIAAKIASNPKWSPHFKCGALTCADAIDDVSKTITPAQKEL